PLGRAPGPLGLTGTTPVDRSPGPPGSTSTPPPARATPPARPPCPRRKKLAGAVGTAPASRGENEVFESLLPAAQNGQDAQELHVQPHQRQSDAEGGGPGVLARYTITHAAADLVEVHDQTHRGQEHRDRTDHHTDRQAEDLDAAHAEGTTDVGEPHDSEVDQAEQAVADQPDHHDL